MPAELTRRFERRSRTYEARALPTELHQHNFSRTWRRRGELHSRLICSAGRRLAVLATPPQTFLTPSQTGAEYGNCTRVSGLAIRGTAPVRTPRWSEQWESN